MTFLCKLFSHKFGPPKERVFVAVRNGVVLRETHTECLRCGEKRVDSRIEPLPDDHVVAK